MGIFWKLRHLIQHIINSQPQSLAVGDFNNDSEMDIAVVMAETNNIAIISKMMLIFCTSTLSKERQR